MKRILVADDSVMSRELMREVLECEGFEVEEAADGRAALARLGAGSFDLVLLDIQMPLMDGFAVLRAARSSTNGNYLPPIVALTAYAMQGDRERALAAGFADYITKPIQIAELREHLSRLLG